MAGYDKQGRIVIFVRQRLADPDKFNIDILYKTFLILFTLAMEGNRQAYCRGYVIVSDQDQVTIRHAMMCTSPTILKQHMVVFQDSYPMDNQVLINNSRMFIINMGSILEKFLNIFRSALDQKYQNILRPLGQQDVKEVLKEVH